MHFDSMKVRRPPTQGFGWVDRRIITAGHLAQMNQVEAVIYLVLCVVADRNGISYYRPETLARLVKQSTDRVLQALEGLASRNFIAADGRFVQVTNLDDRDPPREDRPESPGAPGDEDEPPARVAGTILEALPPSLREALLEKARARLRPMLGNRAPRLSVVQAMAVSLWKEESSS